MINLAVIELKVIIKYFIKITMIIGVIVGLTKYFSGFKTKLNIDKSSFLACLDTVIPSIRSVNKKAEETTKAKIEPLKMVLSVELGMIDSIEKSISENTNNETNNEETSENDKSNESSNQGQEKNLQS